MQTQNIPARLLTQPCHICSTELLPHLRRPLDTPGAAGLFQCVDRDACVAEVLNDFVAEVLNDFIDEDYSPQLHTYDPYSEVAE